MPAERDLLAAAMLSVHAHALHPDGVFPPPISPMPLQQAAGIINDDKHRLTPSRRRRAIAVLAARGLGRDPFDAAIRRLGGDPEGIAAALAHAGHAQPAMVDDPNLREIFVADMYKTPLAVGSCVITPGRTDVYDLDPSVNSIVEFDASTTTAEAAKGVDPQSWDDCGTLWKAGTGTYLLVPQGTGWMMDPMPPNPGVPYTGRRLFEHARYCEQATGICPSWFKVHLNVDTFQDTVLDTGNVARPRYRVSYGFAQSLGGDVYGVPKGIDIDTGEASVTEQASGGVHAYGTKTLHFTTGDGQPDDDLTRALYEIWRLHRAELSKSLEEMVCCYPKIEAPVLLDVTPLP